MTNNNPKEVISTVVENIKKARKQKEYSHENMADALNISVSAYNKIERQYTKLTLERLLHICSILDLSINKVFNIKPQIIYKQDVKENGIGNQGIENLYQDNRELTESYIQTLKEEIVFLKGLVKKQSKTSSED